MTEIANANKLINDMLDFQKKNNIKDQCVTNSQVLYDMMKENTNLNVKVIPVIVDSYANGYYEICCGHLVVVIDEVEILESSYDILLMPERNYYKSIKEYLDKNNTNYIYKNKENLKELVEEFIDFTKIAEQMNKGKGFVNKKYFYPLTDYIMKKYNMDA